MKRSFLLVITILLSYCSFAKEVFKVKVVDKTNSKPIPYVSVVLLKSNLVITIDEKGEFELAEDITITGDTLLFSVFGFCTIKHPASYFNNFQIVELTPTNLPVNGTRNAEKPGKRFSLNEFQPKKVKYFLGLQKSSEVFNFLQVAQKFEVPAKNVALKQVSIFRLVWEDIEREMEREKAAGQVSDTGSLQKTTFRVRIYDVDSVTGLPGKDLSEIEVKDRRSNLIKVNLSQHKIIVPQQTFFVAVEWLRIPYNLSRTAITVDEKLLGIPEEKAGYGGMLISCYKPILGMSAEKGSKFNTYALTYQNEWVPYTHFAPELTDFAISAEVEY